MDIKRESEFISKFCYIVEGVNYYIKNLFSNENEGEMYPLEYLKSLGESFSDQLDKIDCDNEYKKEMCDAYKKVIHEVFNISEDNFTKVDAKNSKGEDFVMLKNRNKNFYNNLINAYKNDLKNSATNYLDFIGSNHNCEIIQEKIIKDMIDSYTTIPVFGNELTYNIHNQQVRYDLYKDMIKYTYMEPLYYIKSKDGEALKTSNKEGNYEYILLYDRKDAKELEKDISNYVYMNTISPSDLPTSYDSIRYTYLENKNNQIEKEIDDLLNISNDKKTKKVRIKKEKNIRSSSDSFLNKFFRFIGMIAGYIYGIFILGLGKLFALIGKGIWNLFKSIGKGVKKGCSSVGSGVATVSKKVTSINYSSIFSLSTLLTLLPLLLMSGLITLEITDLIYKVEFDVNWIVYTGYDLEISRFFLNWMKNFDHNFFSAITLGLLQLILIAIGFVVDVILTILIYAIGIILALLLMLLQLIIIFGLPVLTLGFGIYMLVKAISDDDSLLLKILSVFCILLVLVGAIFYYRETITTIFYSNK